MDAEYWLGEACRYLWYQVPRKIRGYRWNDFTSNQRLRDEPKSTPVTNWVGKRVLDIDLSRNISEWRRPEGRPGNSWLEQFDRCYQNFLDSQLSIKLKKISDIIDCMETDIGCQRLTPPQRLIEPGIFTMRRRESTCNVCYHSKDIRLSTPLGTH